MLLHDLAHRAPVQVGPACSWHGPRRSTGDICWIVIHDAEAPSNAARGVANYGASSSAKASWHMVVDDNVSIRQLGDDVVAYHAYSPANQIGLGIELCGYAAYSKLAWYRHQATLKRAAWQVARWCVKYDIPPRWLTGAQIIDEAPGMLTHADVTNILGKGNHSDPGPNFPRGYFQLLVRRRVRWILAERA
jgi:N-acetylmuramoyl-L-alanine amidase CwlA